MYTRDILLVHMSERMSRLIKNKEKGWQQWLKCYELQDPTLGEDIAYMQFQKLSKVYLGVVMEDERGPYLQDLMALEPVLVFGEAIGYTVDCPFKLHLSNPATVKQKPIVYPKTEWQ